MSIYGGFTAIEEETLFGGREQFSYKNLRPEIFNDKKVYNKKYFSL